MEVGLGTGTKADWGFGRGYSAYPPGTTTPARGAAKGRSEAGETWGGHG